MRPLLLSALLIISASGMWAQSPAAAEAQPIDGQKTITVPAGTKIPLTLIKGITTKTSMEGDRVYLETAFPILADGRIAIPPGSYVAGTVTQVVRPGKVKGRGELYVRFDSLVLPNGVTRDFRARIGSLDASSSGELDRSEGIVKSEGGKTKDAKTVGGAAGWGTVAGGVIGGSGMGAGIGAAAGATAGLVGVLFSRGPDAVIERGSTLEMILDRNLRFAEPELNFGQQQPQKPIPAPPPGAKQGKSSFPGVPQQAAQQ